MPNLQDLLDQTMLGMAARGSKLPLVPINKVLHTPKPMPHQLGTLDFLEHEEAVLLNQIWRFSWDPANPATITDVKINSRGMGMDYVMAMLAFEKVEFQDVIVTRQGEAPLELYLTPEFLVGAWWSRGGKISSGLGGRRLWALETNVDVGLVAVFGYELGSCGIQPLTAEAVAELGDTLIPPKGDPPKLVFNAGEVASAWVCVGTARYIVAVELVLAKERPDFVPGNMIGFARINPHVLVWSNDSLAEVEATILLDRPAKATPCGDEMMKREVKALIVSDTNDTHSLDSVLGLPVPYTDNLYDYYHVDAYDYLQEKKPHESDHPSQMKGEVTLADARKHERILTDVVKRQSKGVSNDMSIRKCRRQGQFDNVHLASRMKVEFDDHHADPPKHIVLDDIVMLNMCLHDCVHMHVRWSEFLDDNDNYMLHGWGASGPYSKPGAPQVPLNQTVFLSLPSSHTIRYRALATDVAPGDLTVFCHHGCAYAVDRWPTAAAAAGIAALHLAIRERAAAQADPYSYQFPDNWLEFYWRIRWMRVATMIVERLRFSVEECIG